MEVASAGADRFRGQLQPRAVRVKRCDRVRIRGVRLIGLLRPSDPGGHGAIAGAGVRCECHPRQACT